MACKKLNKLLASDGIHVLCKVCEGKCFSGGVALWVAGCGWHVECWCCMLLLLCKEVGEGVSRR